MGEERTNEPLETAEEKVRMRWETAESPPLLELWLPADPEAVPPVRRRAMRACTDAGLNEEDCFTLDLALGEALANAVMHGAPQRPLWRETPTTFA